MKKQMTQAEMAREAITRLLSDKTTAPMVLATKVIHAGGVKLAMEIAFNIVRAISSIYAEDGQSLPAEIAGTVEKAQKILPAFNVMDPPVDVQSRPA